MGYALFVEFNEKDSSIIDEVMEVLKRHPEFELLRLKHEPVLALPGLEIDLVHRKVYCDNQEISLTAKEYDLLCLLAVNKGRVLTYDQIYRKVWGEEAFGTANNAIKCHIRNLREKLCDANIDVFLKIRCVREVGYCLEMNSEEMVIT